MLACYLTWHLRRAWAPLTFTDQDPPAQDNPVTPARRSAPAQAKASGQHDPAGRPYRSFRGLLEHLAKRKLKKIQYRPHLINGCLAATGLTIEPW